MLKTTEIYLKKNIDEKFTIEPWENKNNFSLFLRSKYNFYKVTILGIRCIFIEAINEMPNIDQLQKHIKQIKHLTDHHIVLVYKAITRYRRKSLIERRISFVVEDGQMYLPFLGLDLKRSPEYIKDEVKRFTTPTQIAFIYFLYHKEVVINTSDFAKKWFQQYDSF